MIHVDRSKVPVPEILRSEMGEAARRKAKDFFSQPFNKRAQQRFEFDPQIYLGPPVKEALTGLFHGKCAYCESRLALTAVMELDHFRPKSQPVGFEMKESSQSSLEANAEGYWWLAYEWENLYAACPSCNRNKRNRFPVAGRRAQPGATGALLLDERALLLDPCVDEPQRYLEFEESGVVRPQQPLDTDILSLYGGYHRGEVTIEILGLNREGLTKEREATTEEMRVLFKSLEKELILAGPYVTAEATSRAKAAVATMIQLYMDIQKPYLALRRQLLDAWSKTIQPKLKFPEVLEGLGVELPPVGKAALPPMIGKKEAAEPPREKPPAELRSAAILPTPAVIAAAATRKKAVRKRAVRGARTPYIQSIEIENFKAIERLRLEFSEGVNWRVGWKVLLGENGTGKSSVLQAVALALIGPEYLKRARAKPRLWLRKLRNGKHAKSGAVRIQLSTEPHPLELRFTERGFTYERGLAGARVFLRAYGSTRRLQRKAGRMPKTQPLMRVDPLFNPGAYICDASAWMRQLPKRWFDSVALTMKDLMQLETGEPLKRNRSGVNASVGGVSVTLDELSDGYQSVLAMAADILAGAPEKTHDMRNAVGIVLLDEIDAHLHPRWKMRIVGSLRRAFPRLQFLVTTHEPLCLRGLEEKEITLMRRVGGQILAEQNLPSLRGLRVDQILTSPFFGLGSTIDPELDKDFMDYYALLLMPETALTDQQRALRENLKNKLEPYRVLGDTPRDKLIAEVIDEYLAKEVSGALTDPSARLQVREETKQRVADLWKQVNLLTQRQS